MQTQGQTTTFRKFIVIGLAVGASALAGGLIAHAAGLFGPVIVEEQNGARREVQAAAEIDQPTISFIDSPSATCYQPVGSRNDCYITWNYLNVSAGSSQYIISMTIAIDNQIAAYHAGFFQTSMYIPGDLFGPGFKAACGPRKTSGLGNSYAYTIRARETGGLSAANYGSVQCPGVYLNFLPSIRR